MTYATFKVDVDAMLARDDVAAGANVDLIVKLAEAALRRDVYGVAQSRAATLSANARSIAVPTDFRAAISLYVNATDTRIDYLTPEQIRQNPAWTTGSTLVYYTIEADSNGAEVITFAPAGDPTTPTSVIMQYWSELVSIITADTNALIVDAYDLYLFCVLREAGSYLQDAEIETRYADKYRAALQAYNLAEQRKRYAGNAKIAAPPQGVIV